MSGVGKPHVIKVQGEDPGHEHRNCYNFVARASNRSTPFNLNACPRVTQRMSARDLNIEKM